MYVLTVPFFTLVFCMPTEFIMFVSFLILICVSILLVRIILSQALILTLEHIFHFLCVEILYVFSSVLAEYIALVYAHHGKSLFLLSFKMITTGYGR
jgi:hypothetical protein